MTPVEPDSSRKRKIDDEENTGGGPAKRSKRGGQKRKGGQRKNAGGQTPPSNAPPVANAVNPADYVRVVPVGKRASGAGGLGEGTEGVVLSRVDKASMMKVEEGCRVTSSKGYRTVRMVDCR